MIRPDKVRVLYVGFTKHGFLWLKRRRTWLVQVRQDVGYELTPSGFLWDTVSRHFDKADAQLEARLWKSNQN
ncbi:hypothetical protein phiK7B1_100 [Pseudomonas phage phiK7B1]|jgi:hypothetical protein|uniref:Uncharacterized protein n=1 Tax=Pseudomonas phage Nican01 TaxID=3138540 RepID=A0AAU6W194_9CAUD|nr:hypothetical protein phiK7B1_100 [Pseudomonas phage phiK7B1]